MCAACGLREFLKLGVGSSCSLAGPLANLFSPEVGATSNFAIPETSVSTHAYAQSKWDYTKEPGNFLFELAKLEIAAENFLRL